MKIVILDGYTENPGDLSWDMFKKLGDVAIYDRTPEEEVLKRIGNAEIVITNKVPFDRERMLQLPNLKHIAVTAAGYNTIDVEAAKELGIIVTNTPNYGSNGVAQMTFAHILEITNNVALHSDSVKKGEWSNNIEWCYWHKPIIGLKGKRIGIIGYGNIGKEVGNIAKAFGMDIAVYDKNNHSDVMNLSLDEIFKTSDIITLHCPLLPETKNIICKENIEKMKDGVIIINTSRGPLVNGEDLTEAVKNGKVYAAGVDVLSSEPPALNDPMTNCENVNVTPHIAWAAIESRQNIMDICFDNLKSYLEGNPKNVVNK